MALGARAKSGAFDDNVGCAFTDGGAGVVGGSSDGGAHGIAEGIGHGDVRHDAVSKERGRALPGGAINELGGHRHVAGVVVISQAADSGDGEHALDTQGLQGPEVRALGELRGEERVAAPVPCKEGHSPPFEDADADGIAGGAEGGIDNDLFDGFESGHLVEA